MSEDVVAVIERLMARAGEVDYGEGVSMLAHMLQVATLARADGADDALVAASLLHDIGTFVSVSDGEYGEYRHDRSGGAWLAPRFGAAVSEPVRLHVEAKRYLCAVEPGYHDRLSPASAHTLSHQGGPMSATERAAFESEPWSRDALRLRHWDDAGKVPGLEVPPLSAYRCLLRTLAYQ